MTAARLAPGQRLDPEWIAFLDGVKPAVRATFAPEEAAAAATRFVSRGWSMRRARAGGQDIFYLARTDATARELMEAEAPLLSGGAPDERLLAAHRALGALLGFPGCCVEAFVGRVRRGVRLRADGTCAHEDFVAAEEALRGVGAPLGRLNNLLFAQRARLVSFYPCRYDCASAAAYAEGVFGALHRRSPAAAAALRQLLCSPLALAPDGRRSAPQGASPGALRLEFSSF